LETVTCTFDALLKPVFFSVTTAVITLLARDSEAEIGLIVVANTVKGRADDVPPPGAGVVNAHLGLAPPPPSTRPAASR